jgi:hypothetical protein
MFMTQCRHRLPADYAASFSQRVAISPGLDRELQGFGVATHISQGWSWQSLMKVDRANEGSRGWGDRLIGMVTPVAAAFQRCLSRGPCHLAG